MLGLLSDNVAGIHPKLLAAIGDTNTGYSPSYADDAMTRELNAVVSNVFDRPVGIFLTSTGTAANALAIATLCPPWKRALVHRRSHVMESEAGAPEAFLGGGKLSSPAAGLPDRMTAEGIEASLARHVPGDPHSPIYGVVSLSQSTESGTVYTCDELAAVAEVSRRYGARLHIDGARMANSLVSLGCSAAEMARISAVDAISLGITKNGGAFCDMLVLFDLEKTEELRFRQMRAGQLLAKHRFLAAQALAYFADGLWLDIARTANERASQLSSALDAAGMEIVFPVQANQLFVVADKASVDGAVASGHPLKTVHPEALGRPELAGLGKTVVRLVTSWQTERADVSDYVSLLSSMK